MRSITPAGPVMLTVQLRYKDSARHSSIFYMGPDMVLVRPSGPKQLGEAERRDCSVSVENEV